MFKIIAMLCLITLVGSVNAHPNKHVKNDPTRPDFSLNGAASTVSVQNNKVKTNDKVNVDTVKNTVIKPKVKLPVSVEYQLNAISSVGNQFRAKINNQWLEQGQFIGVVEIMKVEKDKVLIVRDNKIYELSLSKKKSVFEIEKTQSNPYQEVVGGSNE